MSPPTQIFGQSLAMRRILALLPRLAGTDATVLLEGETGTGKSALACALHAGGPRAGHPFVVVDCGAIPPALIESVLFGHDRGAFTGAHVARAGAFEGAAGGTVLLDEIGELPLELQPKLLRVLEAREVQRLGDAAPTAVDVRIIAATNRPLREMVGRGTFRSDLYYRLQVVTVAVPPLRERREDIPGLVERFYAERTAGARPPAELVAAMVRHDWPGNVRELKHAIERAIILGDLALVDPEGVVRGDPAATEPPRVGCYFDADPFDPSIAFRDAKGLAIARWERWYVRALLQHSGGNLSKAARDVQSDRAYLRKLVRRHGMVR